MFSVANYIVAILAVAFAAVYLFLRNKLTYWKKRNVPTLESHNTLFGDFTESFLAQKSMGERFREIYDAFGEIPFGGVYMLGKPILLIKDLDLVKRVLVKDFSNFYSRGFYHDSERQPISGHLFALSGPKWRRMRVKLTPTFTTGKMKMMFDTLSECSNQLQIFLEKEVQKDNVLNVREILARFSTDVVASVAFGIQCNSIHNPDAEFRVMGKKVFEASLMVAFRNTCYLFLTPIAKLFNVAPTSSDVIKFMSKVIKDTVIYRETNKISRPDLLNLMIEMKNNSPAENGNADDSEQDNKPITMDEIIAQAYVFFIAGYETTSTTTGFTLYELARRPEIQEKVRREIDTALKNANGKVSYELLFQNLPYTDQVVNESLRFYPAVPVLTRVASEPTEFSRGPGKPPLKIEKDQMVALSVSGIHLDPKHYSNPEIFDPERFSPENSGSRHKFAHIPFGEGPRICIGMRFGLMQVKLTLVNVLSRFKVEKCPKTLDPMEFDAKSFVPFPKGGLYLRLVPRDDV